MNLTSYQLRSLIKEEISLILKESNKNTKAMTFAIKELGFRKIEYISSGQYGDVFKGVWKTEGNIPKAIKVLNYDNTGKKEAYLYRRVSDARSKSAAIAKHFPKVDLVRVSPDKKFVMIVMELLENDPNVKGVIEDIFGHFEVGAYRPDIGLRDLDVFKDIGYRANMMVVDTKSRSRLLEDMTYGFPSEIKNQIIKTILPMNFDSMIFPEDRFSVLKARIAFRKHPLWDNIDVAEEDLVGINDKKNTGQAAMSFMFYFLAYSIKFFMDDGALKENDILDKLKYPIEQFIESYRNYTPVGIGGPNYPGAPKDTEGLGYPGAKSLLQAISDMENIVGLEARDMHDRNVLVRPDTKDIVIVDVGLFKSVSKGAPSYEQDVTVIEGKMSKSYCMKTPCKDMGFSQRASCAKYKKCPSPKSKNERKLTKPEYKKKKEIAKALEKDSPSMPDDKKYAIATAAAKRVAEEQCLDERCQKGYKTHPTRKTKKMFGRTYRNCVKAEEGKDPAKGTGKKPKGSSRRLYTDEDPSDTVSVSFKSVSAIQKTLAKKSFKSKSHKRQSQIINLIHQRARAAYQNAKDPKTKARLKKAYEYAKKRKEASKRKTIRMRKKKNKK